MTDPHPPSDDWKLSRCVHCGETGNDCRCPVDDPPDATEEKATAGQ